MLKDLPKELITAKVIDKVGDAIGIPLGVIFDIRDAKQFVHDLYKSFVKNPSLKLLTPDGKALDLDSPMLFSKETDPIKGGNLSGGKKTILNAAEILAIEQELSKKAIEFKVLDCMNCAEALSNIIKSKGGQGVQLDITCPKITNIWSDKLRQNISTNGNHRAVLFEGKVYDNIYPEGIDYTKWTSELFSPSGYTVTKKPF